MKPIEPTPVLFEDPVFLKRINLQLFALALIMTACFFTWSENVTITRVIKVLGRMGMLIASWSVYRSVLAKGAVDNVRGNNLLVLTFYLFYLLLGLASFMWSTDVSYSALQWFMTSQTLLFCFYFIKTLYILDQYYSSHSIRLYNIIGNAAFALMLVFVVGMWLDPDTFYRLTHGGEEARLGGYLMNPNELGMLAGVGIGALLFDIRRNHQKWWTFLKLAVLFFGLMATGSRSSLVGVLLIIVFHVLHSKQKRVAVMAIAVVLLTAPVAVYKVVLKDGDPERMEELLTLTGRLPFWEALINEGLPREPLLGFGFMRIDYKEFFQSVHTYPGKMTHNTFMQVLMNLGLVGLLIALFQVFFTIQAITNESEEKRLMLFCLLIPLFINSFTEFGIFGESNYGILFYQLIILYVSFKPGQLYTSKQRLHLIKASQKRS